MLSMKEIISGTAREITTEKLEHYLSLTSSAISKVRPASGKGADAAAAAKDFLDMASRYLSDANHFKAKGDFVNAFACVNYAHGFLDAGARIRVFEIDGDEDNALFAADKSPGKSLSKTFK